MKLRRFESSWNGQKSSKAYNPKPTVDQVKEAQLKGKFILAIVLYSLKITL